MPTSDANICNLALGHIGITEYIEDLVTDQGEEAETCNEFYANVRDACLAAFPWPFATLRATLAQRGDEPTRAGYRYIFGLPADCLKARKIWPTGQNVAPYLLYDPPSGISVFNQRAPRADQRVPFAIEKSSKDDGRVLLCDLPSPVLFYTARVKDPEKFPALFTDAFSWLLASEICMPLKKDEKRVLFAEQKYRSKILIAWADALNEGQEDPTPDSDLITARY